MYLKEIFSGMKVLILNGERKGESVLDFLQETTVHFFSDVGWLVETVFLRDKKIASCTGCFGCWTKTPGTCVINDFGTMLAGEVVNSDLMIYLTPVTFGGYSSELKKAIDRFACSMLLPFFTKIDGEVHHRARYKHLPGLLGIGMLPVPEEGSERIFRKLVERNAINIHSSSVQSAVYYLSQDRGQIVADLQSILRNMIK
jgi:multimeric flavodoxin WrbA